MPMTEAFTCPRIDRRDGKVPLTSHSPGRAGAGPCSNNGLLGQPDWLDLEGFTGPTRLSPMPDLILILADNPVSQSRCTHQLGCTYRPARSSAVPRPFSLSIFHPWYMHGLRQDTATVHNSQISIINQLFCLQSNWQLSSP